ncbi:Kelch motif family protein [Histomonas meleagridis]|uniref:Kelch motif family protein n=1 Tax=Histomonas meleagridis TaxID=135588 RepID=UPI003559AA12|nr:Kelch motif family protein [Histomonas meleagridis]KAH0799259.1 Kelch motif family protein [Histomonas meleagridis]
MGLQPSVTPQMNFLPNPDYIQLEDETVLPTTGASPISKCQNVYNKKIVKSAFEGIWSVTTPDSSGPCSRTGNFYVYDNYSHTAYIGYGLSGKHEPLFDLWALDTFTRKWREIKLTGLKLSGRIGSRSCLIGTHLVIFGGYSEPNYFGDLHTIDINTGEVQLVVTKGQPPTPRSTPITAIYNNKFYVWGGFNGNWPNELNVLDFSNMTWTQYPQGAGGRTAVPSAIIGNKLYSYGGSKSGGMIEIDFDNNTVNVRQTIGSEPPSNVMGAGMVKIENYLIYFGGKAKNEYTLMYGCNTKKMWWFLFYILPDGESVTVNDGKVNDIGIFMVPRIHSFSVCYVPEKRELVAFLGYPTKDPPQLFLVNIGQAMGVVHLQDDLLSMLSDYK